MASLDQTIEKSKSAGEKPVQKLTLFALTAMVVGSMIGSGIFSLPRILSPGSSNSSLSENQSWMRVSMPTRRLDLATI